MISELQHQKTLYRRGKTDLWVTVGLLLKSAASMFWAVKSKLSISQHQFWDPQVPSVNAFSKTSTLFPAFLERFQSSQTLCSSPWCYIPCEFQASNKHRCSIIYAYAWFSSLNQSPLKNIFIQISKPLLLEGPISGSGMGHRICISNKYKEKN